MDDLWGKNFNKSAMIGLEKFQTHQPSKTTVENLVVLEIEQFSFSNVLIQNLNIILPFTGYFKKLYFLSIL